MRPFAISIAVGLMLSGPALAELKPYSSVGAWNIMMDGDRFDNCFAESQYGDGTLLRAGFLDDGKKSFLALFNSAWTQFEEGARTPVLFVLDDAAAEGDVYGRRVGDMHGAEIVFNGPLLLEEIATSSMLSLSSDGTTIASVGLEGSAAALEQVAACQATR